MSFGISRLGRGEWIVGAGSVALLASMLLLPWYGHGSASVDGWNGVTHLRWLAVVTLGLALSLIFLGATRRAPAVPVTISLFVAVLGAATSAWLIYRVGISPAGGRKAGGWIGLAGAIAIAYGGLASMRREGIAPADAPSDIPVVDPWAEGAT